MISQLSISVMAHPTREDKFAYLRSRLGEDTPFAIDDGRGIVENCLHAWALHDPEATHHVVIQDDGIICDDFKEKAEAFIDQMHRVYGRGHKAFSFYFGARHGLRPLAQEGMKHGHAIRRRPGWGVAICLPVPLIPEMIREVRAMTDNAIHDDARIGNYLAGKGVKVYYPMPSLIDHSHGHSLVGDPGENRHAFAFIDTYEK